MDVRHELQPPKDVDDITRAIVEYLRVHPQAADTSLGIARWWLDPRMGPISQHALEDALERLVASGQMVCEVLKDGQRFYRRCA